MTSIERVNNVMMPLLLLVLLVSFYWSLTLKYASHGIAYLFTPDWGELQYYSGRGQLTVQVSSWGGLTVPRNFGREGCVCKESRENLGRGRACFKNRETC